MKDLLDEYKNTLEFTKIEIQYLRAGKSGRQILSDSERTKRLSELSDPNSYYAFLLYAETNLLAVIELLEPKYKDSNIQKHSIERLTTVVDPDDTTLKTFDKYSHDTLSVDEIAEREYKKKLIKAVAKSLTKQQKDILDLYSRGFTHKEISEMLDCTRQNITATLKAIRKKIKDEGWLMV